MNYLKKNKKKVGSEKSSNNKKEEKIIKKFFIEKTRNYSMETPQRILIEFRDENNLVVRENYFMDDNNKENLFNELDELYQSITGESMRLYIDDVTNIHKIHYWISTLRYKEVYAEEKEGKLLFKEGGKKSDKCF